MKCKNCKEEMYKFHTQDDTEIYQCHKCPTIMMKCIETKTTTVWFKEDKSKGKKK